MLRSSLIALVVGALFAANGCTTRDEPPAEDGGSLDAPIVIVLDGAVDAGPATCEPGEIECAGTCTRVVGDSRNCGSCGVVCPSGVSCALGRCDCAAPMLGCDGACIDPTSDETNCGACGNACGATEICSDGSCVPDCDPPRGICTVYEEGKATQICADLQTDPMNCGGCNTACAGGTSCVAGRCTCPGGQMICDRMCTDVSTDAENCGACLNSCGADGVCAAGRCTTCGTGLTACGSPARCVDTDTSRLHCGACGAVCGAGESCNSGVCECFPGLTDCDGTCSDIDTDPRNCGGCGIDCGEGGTCTAGVCGCAAGFMMCGPSCHVLSRDHENCGACGTACATDETCRTGTCTPIGSFRITSFGATNCSTLEHVTPSGDDRGGIAVSGTTLFVTGDTATVRVAAGDLTGLATVDPSMVHNGLVSDLQTEQVYVLLTAADTQPNGTATITQLGVVDGTTGAITAARIALSMPIAVVYGTGVFAGYQEALIAVPGSSRLEWWHIELPSGLVTRLGDTQNPTHRGCENWAWWGVAERWSGTRYASYVATSTEIARIEIPDTGITDTNAAVTSVSTFTNLGDMCSITFSTSRNRWYFHHEYDSQFTPTTSFSETLGACDGSFDIP